MTLKISTFDEGRDAEQTIALWRDVFSGEPPRNEPRAMIARKLKAQPEMFLVARQGERVVGTLVGGYDGVRGWMHHLATAAGFRRVGVARQLVRELETRLRAVGCIKLNLQVRDGNGEVHAFYEKLGYEQEPVVSFGKCL